MRGDWSLQTCARLDLRQHSAVITNNPYTEHDLPRLLYLLAHVASNGSINDVFIAIITYTRMLIII